MMMMMMIYDDDDDNDDDDDDHDDDDDKDDGDKDAIENDGDDDSMSQLTDAKKELSERHWIERFRSAKTEAEVEEIMREKMEKASRLDLQDCLFCQLKSESFETNMDHMARQHSFFIPDIEYLVDLQGLIEYLGEKISVHNLCLFCNTNGRQFYSLQACRKHMNDKGHCKINMEEDGDLEIAEFYDFSSTYQDDENDDDDDMMIDEAEVSSEPLPLQELLISEDETELILPSGVKIGHRAYSRYYRQNIRPEDVNFFSLSTTIQPFIKFSFLGSRLDHDQQAHESVQGSGLYRRSIDWQKWQCWWKGRSHHCIWKDDDDDGYS